MSFWNRKKKAPPPPVEEEKPRELTSTTKPLSSADRAALALITKELTDVGVLDRSADGYDTTEVLAHVVEEAGAQGNSHVSKLTSQSLAASIVLGSREQGMVEEFENPMLSEVDDDDRLVYDGFNEELPDVGASLPEIQEDTPSLDEMRKKYGGSSWDF